MAKTVRFNDRTWSIPLNQCETNFPNRGLADGTCTNKAAAKNPGVTNSNIREAKEWEKKCKNTWNQGWKD